MSESPPERPPTPEERQRRTEALFDRIIRIGGMAFGELAQPSRLQPAPSPRPAAPDASPAAPAPRATLIKSVPDHLDLEQARARLPFALRLPEWVPEGFARADPIDVIGGEFGSAVAESEGQPSPVPANLHIPLSVHLMWRNPDGRGFDLNITQLLEVQPGVSMRGIMPVPPGGVREVSVRGTPAALLERQFSFRLPTGETSTSDDAELQWEEGELDYSLRAFRWPSAGETLVRIAESIPPGE